MSAVRFDAVVIGAGANGLVAAATLGRAGLRVLLLERAAAVGGQGRAIEFAPGFSAAPLALDPGWLPPRVAAELGLEGLERLDADLPLAVAVAPGAFLTLSRDPARAAEAIRAHAPADAARWPELAGRLRRLAGFLEALYQSPAPDVGADSPGELLPLLGLGRKFRALGRHDMIEFLRTLPLSVADLLEDAFQLEPLRAAVAAGGTIDYRHGPRAGGTAFVLLHHLVGAPAGSLRGRLPWRDGLAAFTAAAEQAARRHGVVIRTGEPVARLAVAGDAVAGVVLEGGEEIVAGAVLSTADPARTLLGWVDPVWLDPEFLHAAGNLRLRGSTAFVLYALEAPPELPGLPQAALAGVVSLTSTLADLERAADAGKYGGLAERPHVEIALPTLRSPELAPAGRHVLAARVQVAPYRLRDGAAWDAARRERLGASVTAAIESVSPCFASRVLHRAVWSPLEIEERYGLGEGAASQGELGLDQILFMRPLPGYGHHATPIDGLYLGGAGTHPGPGVLGGAGWLAARRLIRDRRGRRP